MSEKAKCNKYLYLAVLQGDYGDGWCDECTYNENDPEEMKDLWRDLRDYRKEGGGRYRVIHRRVPNEEYY